MRVVFTSLAAQELRDATAFYEMEIAGLGERFEGEVKAAISRIVRHPKAWPVERGEVRRCLLPRFPCKVLYSQEDDHLLIIALAHQHRRPDYWVDQ